MNRPVYNVFNDYERFRKQCFYLRDLHKSKFLQMKQNINKKYGLKFKFIKHVLFIVKIIFSVCIFLYYVVNILVFASTCRGKPCFRKRLQSIKILYFGFLIYEIQYLSKIGYYSSYNDIYNVVLLNVFMNYTGIHK